MRRASTFDRQPKVQSNETKVEVKKQLVGVAWTHNLHPTTGLCWTTIFFPLSSQCSLSRPPWHHIWRPFFGLMVLVMVMANPKSHFVLKKYWSTPPLTTQSPKLWQGWYRAGRAAKTANEEFIRKHHNHELHSSDQCIIRRWQCGRGAMAPIFEWAAVSCAVERRWLRHNSYHCAAAGYTSVGLSANLLWVDMITRHRRI